MKPLLLVLSILLFISLESWGQEIPKIVIEDPNKPVIASSNTSSSTSKLNIITDFNSQVELSALTMPTFWDLTYHFNQSTHRPVSNSQKAQLIDNEANSGQLPATFKKYAPYAKKIYNDITVFGTDALGNFFVVKDRPQFSILKFELDQQNLLFIDGGTSDDVYNTIKLTSKQRASTILKSKILPSLKLIKGDLGFTGIKYLAISFTYGSKNFLNDDALNLKPEYLCAVFPITELKSYTNNLLSEDDLIEKSHFFLKDRDATSISKVKIVIE